MGPMLGMLYLPCAGLMLHLLLQIVRAAAEMVGRWSIGGVMIGMHEGVSEQLSVNRQTLLHGRKDE